MKACGIALLNAKSYGYFMALPPEAFSSSFKNLVHQGYREAFSTRPLCNGNPIGLEVFACKLDSFCI